MVTVSVSVPVADPREIQALVTGIDQSSAGRRTVVDEPPMGWRAAIPEWMGRLSLALLTLFALPPVFTSTWRPAVERAAYENGAERSRLARHLFDVATTAAPGKDVRVTGIADGTPDPTS